MVTLNFVMPEKIKEAFSVGGDSYEDEDIYCGDVYLNSVLLDEVTSSPLPSKVMAVG